MSKTAPKSRKPPATTPPRASTSASRGTKADPPVAAPSPSDVLIRMYDIGFGDCFLMQLPAPNGRRRKVLIDCGRHMSSKGEPTQKQVVDELRSDLRDEDGVARVDVIIATHRHFDHISGFGLKGWEDVHVGEVWLPWTEDPDDPEAAKIRKVQHGVATQIARRLALKPDAGLQGMVDNALFGLSNKDAIRTLQRGFAASPVKRYLAGDLRSFSSDLLPGVVVHRIGPSRDTDVIRDLEPEGADKWLRARRRSGSGADAPPFDDRWVVDEKSLPATLQLPAFVRDYLHESAEADAFGATVALDNAVNGTSLFLVFEIGSAVLVFPGDSQWGTWHRALENDRIRELLSRTTFYKVGHHGSHNATPRRYAETVLPKGFIAMCPVRPMDMWPRIPLPELQTELLSKSPYFVRADAHNVPEGFERRGVYVEGRVPTVVADGDT